MSNKYPSYDGWHKDGSYSCWACSGEYAHFDYRPFGVDRYMGSNVEGYNIGVCSEPKRYDIEQMTEIIHKIVTEMGNDFRVNDITYIGTYPFNDAYDRVSSDVWVARLTE